MAHRNVSCEKTKIEKSKCKFKVQVESVELRSGSVFSPTSQTPGSSHPPTPVEFLDYLLLQPLIRDFSLQLFHYALCNTQIMKGKKPT